MDTQTLGRKQTFIQKRRRAYFQLVIHPRINGTFEVIKQTYPADICINANTNSYFPVPNFSKKFLLQMK